MKKERIRKVQLALLSMQRYSWEQGVASQAFWDLGETETAVALAKSAVLRRIPDGRTAVMGSFDAVTDPCAPGEAYEYYPGRYLEVNGSLRTGRSYCPRVAFDRRSLLPERTRQPAGLGAAQGPQNVVRCGLSCGTRPAGLGRFLLHASSLSCRRRIWKRGGGAAGRLSPSAVRSGNRAVSPYLERGNRTV